MLQPEIADIIDNCRICHNLMQGVFHQIFIKGNVFRIRPALNADDTRILDAILAEFAPKTVK